MNPKTVLITGASGMVANQLITSLSKLGFRINTLSRKPINRMEVRSFLWDVDSKIIDEEAVISANYIIHLAGENVASKNWSIERKAAIQKSRIDSTLLLHSVLEKHQHKLEAYIGASAIGYYGNRDTELLSESSSPQTSFLSDVCIAWENAHQLMQQYSKRLVIYRIGVVLEKDDGAFKEMVKTLPFSLNYLGNGKQIISFIHIDDLVRMIIFGIENENVQGIYNAVAPFNISNKSFMQTLSNYKKSLIPLSPVPAFVLRILMGESAGIALDSQNCSANKIIESGFTFGFPTLDEVFRNFYLTDQK